MPNSPSLIVFGAQTTPPTLEFLTLLRGCLLHDPLLQHFLIAIKGLPALWQDLIEHDLDLQRVPGHESLDAIQQWLNNGSSICTSEIPPNVLSSPLTVIIHIVQYFHYLRNNGCGATHASILQSAQIGGIQGFCTGLLSAIAIACSKSEDMIVELAATALRLAVCIGAYVDLDGAFANPPNETSCLVVRWRSDVQKDFLHTVLRGCPEVSTNRTLLRVITPDLLQ